MAGIILCLSRSIVSCLTGDRLPLVATGNNTSIAIGSANAGQNEGEREALCTVLSSRVVKELCLIGSLRSWIR
jgi:hypothetical protein